MVRSNDEYKATRFLYDEYEIVTFPAPIEVYDLLTLGGIRIEVKGTSSHAHTVALTRTQCLPSAFDLFMIRYKDRWVFLQQNNVLTKTNLALLYIRKCTLQNAIIQGHTDREFHIWEDVLELI